MILWKLALRNVFRNRRRSAVSLAAVSLGLMALIFLRGFIHGAQLRMVENITSTITGDIRILPKAQENIYNTNGAIEDPDSIRDFLDRQTCLRGYSADILGGGLVSSNKATMATYLAGYEPEKGKQMGMKIRMVRGRELDSSDTEGALVGEPMREVMGIELGDEIVVTAQDYYGAMTGKKLRLVGTFQSGNDQIDNSDVLMLNATARDLLSFEHRVSHFVLRLKPSCRLGSVVAALKTHLQGSDVTAMTWDEMIPMIGQLIKFQNAMLTLVTLIVVTIVAAGILNTFLMSVVERVREFGLMAALGNRPSGIVSLILIESIVLTLVGACLGVALGWGLCLYTGHVGIDLSRFVSTFSNLLVGSRVYPEMDGMASMLFVISLALSNILAAVYPAWKASRLDPIKAMRDLG